MKFLGTPFLVTLQNFTSPANGLKGFRSLASWSKLTVTWTGEGLAATESPGRNRRPDGKRVEVESWGPHHGRAVIGNSGEWLVNLHKPLLRDRHLLKKDYFNLCWYGKDCSLGRQRTVRRNRRTGVSKATYRPSFGCSDPNHKGQGPASRKTSSFPDPSRREVG